MSASVEDRLARLEWQARLWRRGALVLVLLIVGHLSFGLAPRAAVGGPAEEVAASLKARSFEVVDEKGQLRAQLYANSLNAGAASLRLVSADGKPRARLEETATGASVLNLCGKDGKLAISATVLPNGLRSLSLHDVEGFQRLELEMAADGTPTVTLRDKEAMPVWSATTRTDKDGKHVWTVSK